MECPSSQKSLGKGPETYCWYVLTKTYYGENVLSYFPHLSLDYFNILAWASIPRSISKALHASLGYETEN